MRHTWIPVWPLFQGVLITAAVLGVSVWEVVEWAWPSALFAATAGVAAAASLVKPVPVAGDSRDLTALWPLAAVAALSFLVPLPLAVAAVYLAYVVVNKVDRDQLADSLKYALNPRILAIIVFSLVSAQYIKESRLGAQLAQVLGPYSGLAVFLIPFAVGLATGVEFTFAGLAFPPISSLIHGPALAFAGVSRRDAQPSPFLFRPNPRILPSRRRPGISSLGQGRRYCRGTVGGILRIDLLSTSPFSSCL